MVQPAEHTAEISEASYHRLMSDLTLAGANEKTPYGSGWIGDHPEFGKIAVARVERPASPGHPSAGFYLTCPNDEILAKVTNAIE